MYPYEGNVMKQRMRVIVLGGVVFALTSCQSFPNLLDRSMESKTPDAKAEDVIVTADMASKAAEVDEPRITALHAANARLQRQLAGALRENAKLKRDLVELRDDNSLLKDLAAKKQR
jgi:hypothetical protein